MSLTVIIIIVFVLAIAALFAFANKNNKWVSQEDFQKEKIKLKPGFSEDELYAFVHFLNSYKGGYVRRRGGEIVFQDFTGKEKGDLKGIFFNLVFPNPNIGVQQKEDFRNMLVQIGVNGLEQRPAYETRDSKLRNNKKDEEYKRKEVGNIGEQIVRDALKQLEDSGYQVINGPVLKYNGISKEYDHIVVGENGVFSIETKAFGMSEGKSTKASLFIDPGDHWIIRKNGNSRELESPTQQVLEEKEHLDSIINDVCIADTKPLLVLCNTAIFVKNNMELSYNVVGVNDLCKIIRTEYNDLLTDNDRMLILTAINNSRVN